MGSITWAARPRPMDDDWISMDDRVGRRLGPEFDIQWMMMFIDWAGDSDPNPMTNGFRWIIDAGWAGEPNWMTTGFLWRIDWTADSDSDPTSITTVWNSTTFFIPTF